MSNKTRLNKKVGIVGYGYVGHAMEKFFSTHYPVEVYDSQKMEFSMNMERVNSCDVGLVCVPTPMNPYTSRCCTQIVEEVVDWLETPLIIIKSTVEPGTTDRLRAKTGKRIIFSPEYCGESSYWSPYQWDRDVKESPWFIFGGPQVDTSQAVDLYLPITGPVKVYRQTSALAAEVSKYMENSFYATKITFCYEFANICRAAGLDYNEVRELWLLDPRINPMHTAVFEANDQAFGGKCLPKDTNAVAAWAKEVLGYDPKLLWEVLDSNERIGAYRRLKRNESATNCPRPTDGDHNTCQTDCST